MKKSKHELNISRMGLLVAALLCVLASQTFARPAEAGIRTVLNKDGSSVSIQEFGDEYYHFAETNDGFLVDVNRDGNYVYVGEDGLESEIVAKNVVDRTDEEKAFLKAIDQKTARANHREINETPFPEDGSLISNSFVHAPLMVYNQDGEVAVRYRPEPLAWTTGERWFPVILVGTSDKPYGDSTRFYNYFNRNGYSEDGYFGSIRDYFLFVSDSLFNPHFDVYPVEIDVSIESFGSGNSYQEGAFMAAVLDKLGERSDFQENALKYCSSGKNVDGFFFLYPGMEEDAISLSEKIFWSHMSQMYLNGSVSGWSKSYKAGGVNFDRYVFAPQFLDGSKNKIINKTGTNVHEFSHVMGLGDHYARAADGSQINGPGYFDLMSQGMYNGTYNNAGNVPMGYSAFEKEAVGWLTLQELEEGKVYSLKKLSKMQAYSITNPNFNNEYYIIEYRPAEKYDAYVDTRMTAPRNGVYVWYIDYNKSLYETKNNINGDISHQRIALNKVLEAGGYYVDFLYVNKDGVPAVPGVYNFVFDGERRVCFTTSPDLSLEECPEDSTQEDESSSSEESSSSSAEISSSSEAPESSSSETVGIAANVGSVPQVQMVLEGGLLHVQTEISGLKGLQLFDLQGHLLQSEKFSENSTTLEIGKFSRGKYIVRLTVGNKIIAVKRI